MQLSLELLGLHCWFHHNIVFPQLIRGVSLLDWKTSLTKTWHTAWCSLWWIAVACPSFR